jgi:predicted SprT family Zn-dependent metalloprotease
MSEQWDDKDRMIFLGDNTTSFRCSCGCNVFRKKITESESKGIVRFKCNSCGTIWKGEEI